jgi:hypothetical protein
MENVNGVITQVKESLLNTPLHRPFIDSEPVKVLSQLMDDYPKRTPQQVG